MSQAIAAPVNVSVNCFPKRVAMECVREARVRQSTGIERVRTCGPSCCCCCCGKRLLVVADCSRVAVSPRPLRSQRVLFTFCIFCSFKTVCAIKEAGVAASTNNALSCEKTFLSKSQKTVFGKFKFIPQRGPLEVGFLVPTRKTPTRKSKIHSGT